MKYTSGENVELGDIVKVSTPEGYSEARVVMLGETYEHLVIEKGFEEWVKKDRILADRSIYVEWLKSNPFEHNDPQYAQVGNYMSTCLDDGVILISKAKK